MKDAIVWLRRDLRLADNPALEAAVANAGRVTLVYIHAPQEEAPWEPGAASNWWLHHSLAALGADIEKRGGRLLIRRGDSFAQLRALASETGAAAVYWNRLYEPAVVERDRRVSEGLQGLGIEVRDYRAALLFDPGRILNNSGTPYKVFTPFWRAALARLELGVPSPAPSRLAGHTDLQSLSVAELGLLPEIGWDAGLSAAWTPGEDAAHARLAEFSAGPVAAYQELRNRPDCAGTSRLSPHLHFGELSPQQVAWALEQENRTADEGARVFMNEIGWREFAHHLLVHFPNTVTEPLRPEFRFFPWRDGDNDAYRAWCRGRTGIPLVDAGMRELWHTGWMHNRVRMVVASFLTKNQLVGWQHGARWFWDTLVDADLASNTLGWQWTAGCGADAAPFFRIFNPVRQGQKFDPDETYIRRWCPELSGLPAGTAHEPWLLDADRLSAAGIDAGSVWRAPVVDLAASRAEALAAYQQLKEFRAAAGP